MNEKVNFEEVIIKNCDTEFHKIVANEAKILIIDDNEINLKVAVELLKTLEIQADVANSGKRAIEMVKVNDYDLVFMDHIMPGMDGIEATRAIRCLREKKFIELPIIALTANPISGAREMFKAEGLNDYLSKPIEMKKLADILKKWLPVNKYTLDRYFIK